MKTFLISGVSALALAGTAFAAPFEDADADGDGVVSLSEVQAIDSATSEAEFTLYDVDLDGGLDEDEYATWRVATQGEDEAADDAGDDADTDSEEPMLDDADAGEPVVEEPMTDEPMAEDPLADDPLADDPLADSEPVDLEDVPQDPYEPSPEKSFNDEEDKGEYTGEAPASTSHSFESEAEKLAFADEHGDEHGDDEESDEESEDESDDDADTDDEDGDGNEPWK